MVTGPLDIMKNLEKVGNLVKRMLEKLGLISSTRLDLKSLQGEVSGGLLGWLAGFLSKGKKGGPDKTEKNEAGSEKTKSNVEYAKTRIENSSRYTEVRKAYIDAAEAAKEKKVAPTKVMKDVKEAAEYRGVKNTRAVQITMLCFANFESQFNAKAINYNERTGKGSCAAGLFQFMPKSDRGKPHKKTGKLIGGYRTKLPADKFTEAERDRNNAAAVFDSRVNAWMGVDLMLANARSLGINFDNLKSDAAIKRATLRLYIAHNSGAGNVAAVERAQDGDWSLIEDKTKGDKNHWLWKRPKTTPHVLNYFNKAVDLVNT